MSLPELARRLAFIFNQAALEEKAGLIEGAGGLTAHLMVLDTEDTPWARAG